MLRMILGWIRSLIPLSLTFGTSLRQDHSIEDHQWAPRADSGKFYVDGNDIPRMGQTDLARLLLESSFFAAANMPDRHKGYACWW
jgi:hypothetical protein